MVVMDGARATFYQPLAEPSLGLELTSVTTPDAAVAFVQRFGLLHTAWEPSYQAAPAQLREPVERFIAAADDLRGIIAIALDVRRAVDGNRDALARVRDRFGKVVAHHSGDKPDDRAILIYASDWTALGLSNGLAAARPYVYDRAERGETVPPGRLRVGILPDTLREVCYLTIAFQLADKEPLGICPECQRVFVIEDGRQRFCTPACASRVRFRRFKTKQKEKRSRHGKTTRKG